MQLNPSLATVGVWMNQTAATPAATEPIARPRNLPQRLASLIADAADADQWAIALAEQDETGPAELEEMVPRRWLVALNGGRPGVYDVTVTLRTGSQEFGTVRLTTIRPCGFSSDQIVRAQATAEWAADVLAETLAA